MSSFIRVYAPMPFGSTDHRVFRRRFWWNYSRPEFRPISREKKKKKLVAYRTNGPGIRKPSERNQPTSRRREEKKRKENCRVCLGSGGSRGVKVNRLIRYLSSLEKNNKSKGSRTLVRRIYREL